MVLVPCYPANMAPTPRRFWTRYCSMDDFDDAMLSFALRDAFPNVVFLARDGYMMRTSDLKPADTIPECDQTFVNIWFPDDGWEPVYVPHPDYPDRVNVDNPPRLFLDYIRTGWNFGGYFADRKWAFSLPAPGRGRITSGRWAWDDEQRAFRSTIVKILGRLSNNRLKWLLDRDQYVSTKDAKRKNLWVGYHVMNWCAEEPRRAVDGHWQPPDDWKHKETAWYAELKARVIDRFGEDYGGPREFVPREPDGPVGHWFPL